ncbi:mRNA-decapping enzyme 1A [Anopheles cruzii]|uniref:mRNA-decapping enzyme 1A n=1 Tax=Anopheles cruzii TaxID=68878 RepID=UPI0022EC4356|nr:mRNA-decapping enzyme 1A [Anopheles cruzii]
MADQTELRMNLVAIKRVDPYAKDIVNSSAHVAFYVFNNADSEWEKTDIEGALFIYSRFAEPYHSIFINNRLNTNSLVEPIRGQIELQTKPPFLLYRNERSRIRGFWFYNDSECGRIGQVIQRLVTECSDSGEKGALLNGAGGGPGGSGTIPPGMIAGGGGGGGPVPGMNGNAPPSEPNNVDIFSMLTKAQEDYQNNTTATTIAGNNVVGVKVGVEQLPGVATLTAAHPGAGMVLAGHSLLPPEQISNQNAPRSVVNFFAAAKQPAASEVPLFKTLAPVHTLEQIEKLHRASTPQKEPPQPVPPATVNTGKLTPDVTELKRMGIPIMTGPNGPQTPSGTGPMPELGSSPLATFLSAANLSSAIRANNHPAVMPKTKLIEISELESRQNHQQQQHQQQQQQPTPLHELLKKSDPIGVASLTVTGTPPTASVVRPALMPPTMFKPTTALVAAVPPGGTTIGVTPSSGGQQKAAQSTGKQPTGSKGVARQRDGGAGTTPPKHQPGGVATVAEILSKTAANSKNNNIMHSTSAKASSANGNSKNSNNNNNSGTTGGPVDPLTQNQLIQAVSYLIKHDPDFVRKLHEAYVKSFAEMMISN